VVEGTVGDFANVLDQYVNGSFAQRLKEGLFRARPMPEHGFVAAEQWLARVSDEDRALDEGTKAFYTQGVKTKAKDSSLIISTSLLFLLSPLLSRQPNDAYISNRVLCIGKSLATITIW